MLVLPNAHDWHLFSFNRELVFLFLEHVNILSCVSAQALEDNQSKIKK